MENDCTQRVERWRHRVGELLGREPRGLRDVVAFDDDGDPAVIRVASLVDGKPFPTLFWLIDPVLNLAIDRLEAAGVIAELQQTVDDTEALRRAMCEDHRAHRALRRRFLLPSEVETLERQGMMAALDERGIGGIAQSSRVRCLHTWHAAHLVVPNTIGGLIDARLSSNPQ